VSNSGNVLAVCSDDTTIKLFDISEIPTTTPKLIQSISNTHQEEIISICFSSDNMLFTSVGSDQALILYSVQSNYNNKN